MSLSLIHRNHGSLTTLSENKSSKTVLCGGEAAENALLHLWTLYSYAPLLARSRYFRLDMQCFKHRNLAFFCYGHPHFALVTLMNEESLGDMWKKWRITSVPANGVVCFGVELKNKVEKLSLWNWWILGWVS